MVGIGHAIDSKYKLHLKMILVGKKEINKVIWKKKKKENGDDPGKSLQLKFTFFEASNNSQYSNGSSVCRVTSL